MPSQLQLIKPEEKAHGGALRNRRKGRGSRPLTTKSSMHLVLRSSKATKEWSLKKHDGKIRQILRKFSLKYGVKLHSLANVGNHLHIQLQLTNRHAYRAFIRAITSAIAIAVTKTSRWQKTCEKFWDLRPFTRIVVGRRAYLRLKDYIRVNQIEGQTGDRQLARMIVHGWDWNGSS